MSEAVCVAVGCGVCGAWQPSPATPQQHRHCNDIPPPLRSCSRPRMAPLALCLWVHVAVAGKATSLLGLFPFTPFLFLWLCMYSYIVRCIVSMWDFLDNLCTYICTKVRGLQGTIIRFASMESNFGMVKTTHSLFSATQGYYC